VQSRFYKNYFQSPGGFSLYMLTWEILKLYPYNLIYIMYSADFRLFIKIAELGCCNMFPSPKSQVNIIFSQNAFDAVMHFAAVAYVGESTMEPLK